MIYQTYTPRSPLAELVKFLWLREGDNLPKAQTRLLPTGSMELVIDLHGDRIPLFDRLSGTKQGSTNSTRICGAHSESFIISDDSKISLMGAHFKPGGGAFFRLPAGELHNEIISLEELWQGRAVEMCDRLLATPTLADRFLVLEQFLITMMRSRSVLEGYSHYRHPAVDFALQQFQQSSPPTIRAMTDQVGFSSRYFNQLFRDQVGLTPKLFCRVQRLQKVLALIAGKTKVDWVGVAFTCGYFDQAHFIHDFQAFANCTPTEYLTKRGFHPCHVGLNN
jgi:AraC-like DNA-binding protein